MLRVATRFREACRPGPVWRRSARLHPWLDRSATRTIPASFAERATFLGGEKLLSFVIGTGRCGSSLVTEVIARHPAVGFVSGLDDKLPGLDPAGAAGLAAAAVDPPRPARQRPDSVAGAAPARLLRAPHAGTGAADVRPPRDGLAAGRPAAGGLP